MVQKLVNGSMLSHMINNILLRPLDGSIYLKKTPTMKAFEFHLATGLRLVHSHTYMVTRDAVPLSHVQVIHRKNVYVG